MTELQKAHAHYRSVKALQSDDHTVKPAAGKMWIILGGSIVHTNGANDTIIDKQTQPNDDADGPIQRVACIGANQGTGSYPFPNTGAASAAVGLAPLQTIPAPQLIIMKSTEYLHITTNADTLAFRLAIIEMDDIL